MKDPGIFSLVIILLSLITLSLENVRIMLGEILCWSLLGLKGLYKNKQILSTNLHTFLQKFVENSIKYQSI